jgi:hypothetical protein
MKKSSKSYEYDDSFYKLAGEITHRIASNKDGTDQKQQVEELLDVEIKFKETILKYRTSTKVYAKFWNKVCVTNKNILSARPYFRENAVTFSKKITPSIKAKDMETLKTFNINYQLIKFIRDNWEGPFPARAEQLFHRVHRSREILIENNMPLAINRAKLFYRKTPKSHLSLMDMISICGMGLAAGIDKWCGAYSPVFRSVCIGRMVGNLIDSYSETMLHFYPSDKRVLYKANSIRGRKGVDDINALTEAVNQSFKDDGKEGKSVPKNEVDASELSYLMCAASTISADQQSSSNEEGSFSVYDFTADESQDIEKEYAARETTAQMLSLARELPILHRKVLRLKGIKL